MNQPPDNPIGLHAPRPARAPWWSRSGIAAVVIALSMLLGFQSPDLSGTGRAVAAAQTAPALVAGESRDYAEGAVEEIRKVLELKALGFTIAEIRAAVGPHSEDREVCRIAADKVHALEAEIRRLSEVLKAVKESRRECGCDREPRIRTIKGRSA